MTTSDELPKRGPSLRIIAVNDVYSLESLPSLKGLVAHFETTDPADRTLVTLAGDFLAPSILSSLDSGQGMVECLNAIGVTHVTFGNHEDDVSTDALRKRVSELHAVWLATNVPDFQPRLPMHDIIEVTHVGSRTVRVGLLGVVMDDPTAFHRKPFGGATVEPPNPTAVREAAVLRESEHCDSVIPLTHQPVGADRALALMQRSPPFPVIVGGHEHTVFIEEVEGTWIVKASADAVHAVVIDLSWSDVKPAPPAVDAPLVKVRLEETRKYPEDEALRSRVNAHMRRVEELEKATLVKLAPDEVLSSIGTRARATSLGSLICSRIRDALEADGCLFNGGGIRAGRDYKERFTYGDLKGEVPFDNEIVVIGLKGRVVSDAVSSSRAMAPAESGGFLQIDDRMSVDARTGVVRTIDGSPIDLDREYRIAVVRDLLSGMDHEEPLIQWAHDNPEKIPPTGSGRDVKVVLVDAFARALWSELGAFDEVDENHDGLVDKSELEGAIARYTGEAKSPIVADLVIHALDIDRDRNISREEAALGSKKAPPKK